MKGKPGIERVEDSGENELKGAPPGTELNTTTDEILRKGNKSG